jgi:hypothetical protein
VQKSSSTLLSVLDDRIRFKLPSVISNTAFIITPNGLEPHCGKSQKTFEPVGRAILAGIFSAALPYAAGIAVHGALSY